MNSDIQQLLNEIKSSNQKNTPILVMQCIMLTIMLLKPIIMYWIQAKYKAAPPHESIRKFEASDPLNNNSIHDNIDDVTNVDVNDNANV